MPEILQNLNWVDCVILIILIRTTYVGFSRGLSWEIIRLLGVVVAFVLAIHNYDKIGYFIGSNSPIPPIAANIFSFLVLVFGTALVFKFIGFGLHKILAIELLSPIEHVGGLLLGFIRGIALALITLVIMLIMSVPYIDDSIKGRSFFGSKLLRVAPIIYDATARLFPESGEMDKEGFIERLESNQTDNQTNKKINKKRSSLSYKNSTQGRWRMREKYPRKKF
ncbi:MAG: CvpA family protein [Candidatus Omnitrophica bacterium]|nr:CvpA family protein [Candidatus Omnitrophota bacterium]